MDGKHWEQMTAGASSSSGSCCSCCQSTTSIIQIFNILIPVSFPLWVATWMLCLIPKTPPELFDKHPTKVICGGSVSQCQNCGRWEQKMGRVNLRPPMMLKVTAFRRILIAHRLRVLSCPVLHKQPTIQSTLFHHTSIKNRSLSKQIHPDPISFAQQLCSIGDGTARLRTGGFTTILAAALRLVVFTSTLLSLLKPSVTHHSAQRCTSLPNQICI